MYGDFNLLGRMAAVQAGRATARGQKQDAAAAALIAPEDGAGAAWSVDSLWIDSAAFTQIADAAEPEASAAPQPAESRLSDSPEVPAQADALASAAPETVAAQPAVMSEAAATGLAGTLDPQNGSVTVTRTTTLSVDADSDGVADAGDMLSHYLVIVNGGATPLTSLSFTDPLTGSTYDAGSVQITPIAIDDSFTMTGNTPQTFTFAQLLGNDLDPDGSTAGLSIASVGGAQNGTVTIDYQAETVTFTPNTGYTGAASFTYQVIDAQGLTNVTGYDGTVSLTVETPVWYVDSAYSGANGTPDGSYLRPFTSLAPLNGVTGDGTTNDDVDAAGHTIFIYNRGASAYNGGITLEANQTLIGDGQAFTVNGIAIGADGSNTVINHATTNTGYGVTLSTGNTIQGITFTGGNSGTVGIRDGNGTVGTLTISGTDVNGAGTAVDIDQGGTLSVSLGTLSTSGATGDGVHLQGVSGSFSASSGTIENAGGTGFLVGAAGGGTASSGGNATISYGGTVANATGATIEIQDRTGGTVTFSGNVAENSGRGIVADGNSGTINFSGQVAISSGTSNAIALTNNAAAINFNPTGNGLDIVTTSGTGIVATSNSGLLTITGNANSIQSTTGTLVNLNGTSAGTNGISLGDLSASGAVGTAVAFNNVGGSVNVASLTATGGVTTVGVSITSSSGSFTFDNAVQVTATGSGRGVYLFDNSGASVTFSGGGNGVDLSTATGNAFFASASGTVNVAGTGNTLSSVGGLALGVYTTTIGSSNLNFSSISANGGTNGIVLNTTGSTGGLIVTGDGGGSNNGSGGTIQNMTGDGISLTSTAGVRLGYMTIQNNLGDGIGGSEVNGFLLNRANVTGNGDDAASDESGINIANLTGSAFNGTRPTGITNSVFTNNHEFEVQIANSGNGTLTDFVFSNNTVSDNGSTGTIANLVNFLNTGTGSMTLNASGGSYTGAAPNSATGLHIDNSSNGGSVTANVSGGTFTNNNVAVNASAALSGNLTFDIDGITATGNRSHGINVFVAASSTGAINGTVANNVIGTSGVTGSGSSLGNGISVQNEGSILTGNPLRLLITGNTIQEIAQFTALNVNHGISGQSNTRTMDVTISNNTFGDVDNARALVVQQNNSTNTSGSAGIINASIFGNSFLGTIAGLVGDGSVMRLRQLSGGTFNLVQLIDSAATNANELDDRNNLNNAVQDRISIGGTLTFGATAPATPASAEQSVSGDIQLVIAEMEAAGRAGPTAEIVRPAYVAPVAETASAPAPVAVEAPASQPVVPAAPVDSPATTGTVNLGSLPAGYAVGIYYTSTVNLVQNAVIANPYTNVATVTYSGGTTNSNQESLTVDSLTLGSRVFLDADRDGSYGAGDSGIDGVTLSLFADANNDGIADGAALASTTTAGGGLYSFGNVAAGTYIVQVNAANFQSGGALEGRGVTLDGGDPDDNVDNDNNGISAAGGVVVARPITLTLGSEPTDDGDSDADTNQTLDFGFVVPNQAPTSTNLDGDVVTFTEGSGPVQLDLGANATISDPDSGNFDGGSLTVTVTGPTPGQDGLPVSGGGANGVVISNGNVSVDGVTIGTFAASNGFATLTFAFNANATAARVQAVVRSIGYGNFGGDTPTAGDRTITFTLVDGDGTLGGGTDTATFTTTVNVQPVDDAPVAVADSGTVAENATVAISVDSNDTDVDGGPHTVATIAGQSATVGAAITLASGATATLNADGTITYNPNGRFNALVSAATATATGASNSSATDSFTYGLVGGSSATVTVTINGVDGSGDQLGGSAGNDTLTGSTAGDLFMLNQGGNDTVSGGLGDDGFFFGDAFNANDSVDGGTGTLDTVGLQGDYSAGVTLGASSATGIEIFALLPGSDTRFGDSSGSSYSYAITTGNAAIAAGVTLIFQANTLRAGENFTLDASGELDGAVFAYGGLGTDTLTGGQQNDAFFFGNGRFGASDSVNGGAGTSDTLGLQGVYAGATSVTFGASQISGIEIIAVLSNVDTRFGGAGSGTPYSYTLVMHDGNVAAGQRMTISANTLATDEELVFYGTNETDGSFAIYSGNGVDIIEGSQGDDIISGRGGGDMLTGNGGADRFVYSAVSDSTVSAYDVIMDFTAGDLIDLSAVDADSGTAGRQQFSFIGSGAFSGTAGELRYEDFGGQGAFFGDTDGDGTADFEIFLMTTGHAIGIDDLVGVTEAPAAAVIGLQDAVPLDTAPMEQIVLAEPAGGGSEFSRVSAEAFVDGDAPVTRGDLLFIAPTSLPDTQYIDYSM